MCVYVYVFCIYICTWVCGIPWKYKENADDLLFSFVFICKGNNIYIILNFYSTTKPMILKEWQTGFYGKTKGK